MIELSKKIGKVDTDCYMATRNIHQEDALRYARELIDKIHKELCPNGTNFMLTVRLEVSLMRASSDFSKLSKGDINEIEQTDIGGE